MGVVGLLEHLGVALVSEGTKVFFVIMAKVDICPEHILKNSPHSGLRS
jgi:hypothetical protein